MHRTSYSISAKEQTALDIKQASDYSYHYTNVQIAINDVLELITSNFENLSETSLVEMGIYQYLESVRNTLGRR